MIVLQSLYEKETITVAKELLGCYLFHQEINGYTLGRIIETEAYLQNDPAAHSYRGRTKRNAALFGNSGDAYIYFIYGMHYCLNVVTGEPGKGEAVLIRAVEPVEGITYMELRRKTKDLKRLCNGPGKLAQAFGIDLSLNGTSFTSSELQLWSAKSLSEYEPVVKDDIISTTRIGILKAQDLPLRFYIKNSPYISKK